MENFPIIQFTFPAGFSYSHFMALDSDEKPDPSFLSIFFTFLRIGAFTFGGGLAMLSVMRHELVVRKNLLDEESFNDLIAMATSVPGVIAVNSAFMLGKKLRGSWGSAVSILGVVLPSFIIILSILFFFSGFLENPWVKRFFRGASMAVTAQILFSAINFSKSLWRDPFSLIIAAAAFCALVFFNLHPLFVILGSLIIRYLLPDRRNK